MSHMIVSKAQFPIFSHCHHLVYLDNAATTQKPQAVIDAEKEFYETSNANVHRGDFALSARATEQYEAAREKVRTFLKAKSEKEIIFTSGATAGLNGLAFSLTKNLKPGDNVVISISEHHANFVPWQEMSKQYGFTLRFLDVHDDRTLDLEKMNEVIDEKTKIVSVTHISNVLGIINPIEKIIARAKDIGAVSIIDACQSIGRMPIDVQKLDCDFLVFSGHKMYGPTGIGVLYGKEDRLKTMDPFLYGGGMIDRVTKESATWTELPHKFEAGTPNIAGAIGLGAAIDFMHSIGMEEIQEHEKQLTNYLITKLSQPKADPPLAENYPGVTLIGSTDIEKRIGVVSFTVDGVHPHDVASILDSENVAVRAGHHCCMPLMERLGIRGGTVRVSLAVYNNEEDVDRLVKGVEKVKKIFEK